MNFFRLNDSHVGIHGNCLVMGNSVQAFYVLHPYNYGVLDGPSAERHVDRLHSALSGLYGHVGELRASMFRLRSVMSKTEVIDKMMDTISMYAKGFQGLTAQEERYIRSVARELPILSVSLDSKNSVDVERQGMIDTLRMLFNRFVEENFSLHVTPLDVSLIDGQRTRITNALQRFATPASERLVMNILVNTIMPSYTIVYNDYVIKHASSILSGIQQDFIPHLGWFEMSNAGAADFGAKPRKTYGSVLTILELPDAVASENFNISMPGLSVNMHLLDKQQALLRFKRLRAGALQEGMDADDSGTLDGEDVDEGLSMIQRAIRSVRQGRILTDVDANILVTDDTLEGLDRKKRHVISVLADVGVVCSVAGNQAGTYVKSFIKREPQRFGHCCDLQYALAFQLDHGVEVGDADSKFSAPVIGVG